MYHYQISEKGNCDPEGELAGKVCMHTPGPDTHTAWDTHAHHGSQNVLHARGPLSDTARHFHADEETIRKILRDARAALLRTRCGHSDRG